MIEVQLHRPSKTELGHEPVATLRVEDDNTWTMSGQRQLFFTDMTVLEASTGRRISFEDDPQGWARNLHTALRTGYLVPVVVEDTASQSA